MAEPVLNNHAGVAQRSPLHLLDETTDLLRRRGAEIAPAYFLPALPYAVVAVFFLEAVSLGNISRLPSLAVGLVLTGYLRWLGGMNAQRAALKATTGGEAPPWRSMAASYFWLRLFFFPMCAAAVAADPYSAGKPLSRIVALKRDHRSYFSRLFVLSALFLVVFALQLLTLHYFAAHIVLPYIIGLDSQVFRAVLFSRLWWLGIAVVLLLAWEFFIMVSGVLAYRELASRSTGADLSLRFRDAYGEEACES